MKKPPFKKPRKVHANALLKNLPVTPEDAQARGFDPRRCQQAVAGWCMDGTLDSACSRCASELGLQTNAQSMSEFFTWWQENQATAARKETLKEIFDRADANAKAVGQMLAERGSTAGQIAAAENLVFQLQATEEGKVDREMWIELEKLRIFRESAETKGRLDQAKLAQKDQEIALARTKFELEAAEKMLDAAMRARADEINASGLSNADKIAAMRKAAFAEIDELQVSGKVVVPK